MAADGLPELRIHPPLLREEGEEIASFLRARGLEPEEGADFTVCLLAGGRLIGTGSLSGRVIKALAVDEGERGEGLALRIVSELEAEAGRRGLGRLLVFTKPENGPVFESLGYRLLASSGPSGAEGALLLEKGEGLEAWLAAIRASLPPASARTALVMNCNPFTLGHLHLAREASASSEAVLLFVVEEEASSFPFELRLRLIREGVAGLPNLTVIPGSDYLVSRATFPTYFLKDPSAASAIHARLDLDLFGRRIAPALGIVRRMVGEEPYCATTAAYNAAMKELLPGFGIELAEIPRLELGGRAVSASTVRRLIKEGRLGETRDLLPESSYRYLVSAEAAPVLAAVAAAEGRH